MGHQDSWQVRIVVAVMNDLLMQIARQSANLIESQQLVQNVFVTDREANIPGWLFSNQIQLCQIDTMGCHCLFLSPLRGKKGLQRSAPPQLTHT